MRMIQIAPSILSANFANLGSDINQVISAGADMIHFDVMDNHYVPNLTIGPLVLKSLRHYGITHPIDVHLMVKPVDNMIRNFAEAGANYISFHPEASLHIDRSLQLIKDYGCKAGLALNPATSLDCLEYVIDKLDMILIMLVNPGFSGQPFIPNILKKIKKTKSLIKQTNPRILLSVDGGININNIGSIAHAGANIFVIGSAIFNQKNYQSTIKKMLSILKEYADTDSY
ncbi:ribulose-phosphate 3-epimerase [Candidatus Schneideria nysicola]|uniref:ribulose-phosphate 3-epimerase n=1 Tax=Candidatus Schneideria nysicola TaxID=1081631 RepID=UPI001CAA45E4|nr:ribulose-phosphate 3-epimerase [Candidatus Schneideria nysicola]UAJ65097.1 ribulose-phosphate 3-epimerase [Candidatus Schneideria nysicola]